MKRIYIIVTIVLIAMLSLTACGGTYANDTDTAATEIADLKPIAGKENHLVYDINTRVIYYMFSTIEKGGYKGYGYFGPYVSTNGNFCKYVDGRIVEIVNDTNN